MGEPVSGIAGKGSAKGGGAGDTDVVMRFVWQVADDAEEALQDRPACLVASRPWLEQRRVLEDNEHPGEAGRSRLEPALWPPKQALEAADDGKAELRRERGKQEVETLDLVDIDAGLGPRRLSTLQGDDNSGMVSE
jgi:hypothetical protein